ncbi:MAG: hypothetical protein J6A62_08595 [Oscillospiraceae bacterium]|nr:hypothetical protein [Oscillospiraceae bacterium]
MICKVVGIRPVSFTDGQSGQTINGTSYFVEYPDDNVQGVACEKLFVGANRASLLSYVPKLHDTIRVFYNRYGKVDNIEQHVK